MTVDVGGGASAVATRTVDTDVHPLVKGGIDALYPFMERSWVERLRSKGASIGVASMMRYAHPRAHIVRADAATPDGHPGGSDPAFTAHDLLDRWGIDLAVLVNLEAGNLSAALAGPEDSIVLCSAFNDFFLSTWVRADSRYRYAMVVPVQDPLAAAREIERVGDDPGVAAVFMPPINQLMGHRQFDPIYGAAQRKGLPILVHPTGMDFRYYGGPAPIGMPESYAERYINTHQIPAANITNLIFTGAFERFPELKVVFVEFGFSWALPLLWRMDKAWRGLRIETPWVRKPPSAYVHEHVRLSTQPIDEPEDHRQMHRLIEMLGSDVLLFATDYPHWDNDDPRRTLLGLAASDRERIMSGNASATLRL